MHNIVRHVIGADRAPSASDSAALSPLQRRLTGLLALGLFLTAGVLLAPDMPLSIDGALYSEMARAMAEEGALAIGDNGGVDGAPPLTKTLTIAHNGAVYPQYPSGYAFIAAPFYALFGVRGLMLMNTLSFALCIWLTYATAKRLYNEEVARWAAGVFAIASFAPTYAFAIWPHMIALALWMGAVYSTIVAAESKNRKASLLLFALAGSLVGVGFNIRVDAVLAGLVCFFWLRLFARPEDRLAPLLLFAGIAPWLLFSAAVNDIKFGAFTPFTYSASEGMSSTGEYLPVLLAAAAAMAAAWTLNLPLLLHRCWRDHRRALFIAAAATVCAAALTPPLRDLSWRVLTGLYVLVINLQAHDLYYQQGVERNAFGQLLFWEYPKKALIQSLPWMALIAIPAAGALRGENTKAVGLCFLSIAAIVCFYALNHWHGGRSYSLRYFLPAAPFLAILCVVAYRRVTEGQSPGRRTILLALAAASLCYLGLQELGQSVERLIVPAALYPQWLIAAALGGAIILYLLRDAPPLRRACATLSLVAFAYAAVVSIQEEIGHEGTRSKLEAMARDIAKPLRPGSLVITPTSLDLFRAEQNGVHVMTLEDPRAATQAANAFAAAGRCVYFHTQQARDLIAPYLVSPIDPDPLQAASRRFEGAWQFSFFTFSASRDCRF